jgi:osmotically-inducible protein OsmY
MKTDAQIQKDVIDQIKWEPALNASGIGVAVKNGVVTLSGIVDSFSQKIAVEIAARKVTGVKAVAEDIQVGGSPIYRRTDTEIAQAILNVFKWDTSVPDDKIEIKVEDGVVTLDGEVEWDYQRNAAKRAVERLAGVRRINNFISIKQKVIASDVQQKIAAALHRSATIDAGKIAVEVTGNKVVLTGKVRSFAEEQDAVDAAWSAPGVSSVEDRLEMQEEEFAY